MQRHDEAKPDVFEEEKINVDSDASPVFSSMLESESSPHFKFAEDPSLGSNGGCGPVHKSEDQDMGLEPFSTPESNSVSIPTNDEDTFTEYTEGGSYITTKSDTLSLLHENNTMTESLSTEDPKSVLRKDSEIDDFDRTTSGRETLFMDQSLEMYNTETKNEKDMECESKDRDVIMAEEIGRDANEAENIDSNANTWSDKCEEESLSMQVDTDLVSAIDTDKDQGNSNNSLVGQSVAVSASEHEIQSNTAEEESVLVAGQDSLQFPSESGASYDQMTARQEFLSNGPNAICEQSMLEQEQPCFPSLPLEEKDSLEGSDQNEKQQSHNETIELPPATNETDIAPQREGIEPGELPLATNEKPHTDEESPVVEKTDDAMREATDTGAGNGIQQYAETVQSSFIRTKTNDMHKGSPEDVMLTSQIDEMEGVSYECFKAVEPLSVIGVTESLVMQTDSSSVETKSDVFDTEKIHADTDTSRVLSFMLESASSSPYVEDPSYGPNRGHDSMKELEDSDTGLELFSTPESNIVSIPTDNEDFNAEPTEDGSYVTTKSDTFSLLHENDKLTESPEDAKFVSRKDEEIDNFDSTTIGREGGEALFIDHSLEMHNAEAKNEKDIECEATDRDVNLVEENGEDANEAKYIDSNANTWAENCEEEYLSLQVNTDLVSAIGIDKDQGNSNLGEENIPVGQLVTISATEHANQQSDTAEEEPVLVSGEDCPQPLPESGASYDHMITRQQLPSNGPDAIYEQSLLEHELPSPLLPLGEKNNLERGDRYENQQEHLETVELSSATNETELVDHIEGIESVELPLVTDERSHTNDCDQLEKSSVIEKSDGALREATDTAAGNGIQRHGESIESSVVINEMDNMYKEGSQNVILPSQIDETEGVSNECFKAVEQFCAIDETKGGVVAEAPRDEQQPNEKIEERSDSEKLPKAVRDYQGQINSISLNGSEEVPKSISLGESNVNDDPCGDSSPTVKEGAQVNEVGIKAGELDFVDKAVSQTSDQGIEDFIMDKGLPENILISKQLNEEKSQLQIKEVMSKTASETLPNGNFYEPPGAVVEEQFTSPTTDVSKDCSPTSSIGASLTHRHQESQDLQTFEVDNKASTVVREKDLDIHAERRASIWDCCGFLNLMHAHED